VDKFGLMHLVFNTFQESLNMTKSQNTFHRSALPNGIPSNAKIVLALEVFMWYPSSVPWVTVTRGKISVLFNDLPLRTPISGYGTERICGMSNLGSHGTKPQSMLNRNIPSVINILDRIYRCANIRMKLFFDKTSDPLSPWANNKPLWRKFSRWVDCFQDCAVPN
jgi:hypothetical protein